MADWILYRDTVHKALPGLATTYGLPGRMITVLSLNTAIDRIEVVPGFHAGHVFRAERSLACAGGKGLNVARVVRRLEQTVQIVGFLGGAPTSFIRSACDALRIEQHWVTIDRDSRTCLIVVDLETGSQTVVNEPGPEITLEDLDALHAELSSSTREGDVLCLSGSAPVGVPENVYAGIVAQMRSRGVRTLVDVSGASLLQCWNERAWALTPNYEESRAAFGSGISPAAMARHLAMQAEHAVLTLGAEGVIYASGQHAWHLRTPAVRPINAVGSGDALAAGFLVGMARGYDPVNAVLLGAACGTSNASRLEPDIGSLDEIEQMTRETRITRM